MDYGKITTAFGIQKQPNPVFVTIANPTDEQKAIMAVLRGELEMVYTEEQAYDPETQYITDWWQEENGKAVQHWEVHEKPTPEPTIEDRVDNLEEAVDGIISGETA